MLGGWREEKGTRPPRCEEESKAIGSEPVKSCTGKDSGLTWKICFDSAEYGKLSIETS